MIDILLHRRRNDLRARFVRVEIIDNLFGEYTLLRETGAAGREGCTRISWYANLREACLAAETLRARAQRQGYRLTRASPSLSHPRALPSPTHCPTPAPTSFGG